MLNAPQTIVVRGAFKTMVTSITAGTDSFDMPQFMELCTLTSTPKGYSFAACYCPEDGCTATDLRRQVEFNGSKGSALQDRVQMPNKKKFAAFVTQDLCHRVYLQTCV